MRKNHRMLPTDGREVSGADGGRRNMFWTRKQQVLLEALWGNNVTMSNDIQQLKAVIAALGNDVAETVHAIDDYLVRENPGIVEAVATLQQFQAALKAATAKLQAPGSDGARSPSWRSASTTTEYRP